MWLAGVQLIVPPPRNYLKGMYVADVSYAMGQIAADVLRWQKQADRKWYGADCSAWKPAAGKVKIKAGQFGPTIDAMPSKLTLSLGDSRLTIYVRGTAKFPIVDGVGIVGPMDPWISVMNGWIKQGYEAVVRAVKDQQIWDEANPEYRQSSPNRKPVAKSKLSPDQIVA